MNLVCLADTHLTDKQHRSRKDDCVKTQFDKLHYILSYAVKNADAILIAGDVFDKPRNWILLPQIMDIFGAYKIPKLCVIGQHDMYMYSKDNLYATNMGILKKAGLITVLSADPYKLMNCNFFGMNWGEEEIPRPPKYVPNILLVHAPIAETSIYPGGSYIDVLEFGKKCKGFDLVVCGDIHRRFNVIVGETRLLNPGPLMRRTAEEYNFKYVPGVWMYNTDDGDVDFIEIPYSSASKVLSRSHIEKDIETKEKYKTLIAEISKVKLTDVNLQQNIMVGLKKAKMSLKAKDIVMNLVNS